MFSSELAVCCGPRLGLSPEDPVFPIIITHLPRLYFRIIKYRLSKRKFVKISTKQSSRPSRRTPCINIIWIACLMRMLQPTAVEEYRQRYPHDFNNFGKLECFTRFRTGKYSRFDKMICNYQLD